MEKNHESDKAKALELLLCFLNENFTNKNSIGSIVKKVIIEFESQPNVAQSKNATAQTRSIEFEDSVVEESVELCKRCENPSCSKYHYEEC